MPVADRREVPVGRRENPAVLPSVNTGDDEEALVLAHVVWPVAAAHDRPEAHDLRAPPERREDLRGVPARLAPVVLGPVCKRRSVGDIDLGERLAARDKLACRGGALGVNAHDLLVSSSGELYRETRKTQERVSRTTR